MKNLLYARTPHGPRRKAGSLLAALALAGLAAGTVWAAATIRGSGTCAGTLTLTPLSGSHMAVEINVAGNIMHLGKSKITLHSVADFSTSPPSPVPPTTGIVTAANGDLIKFTLKWTPTPLAPGVFVFTGPFTIVEGTGRFLGAGGGGEYRGVIDLVTGEVIATISGEVTR